VAPVAAQPSLRASAPHGSGGPLPAVPGAEARRAPRPGEAAQRWAWARCAVRPWVRDEPEVAPAAWARLSAEPAARAGRPAGVAVRALVSVPRAAPQWARRAAVGATAAETRAVAEVGARGEQPVAVAAAPPPLSAPRAAVASVQDAARVWAPGAPPRYAVPIAAMASAAVRVSGIAAPLWVPSRAAWVFLQAVAASAAPALRSTASPRVGGCETRAKTRSRPHAGAAKRERRPGGRDCGAKAVRPRWRGNPPRWLGWTWRRGEDPTFAKVRSIKQSHENHELYLLIFAWEPSRVWPRIHRTLPTEGRCCRREAGR